MKTIVKYYKTVVLFLLLVNSKTLISQSCALNYTYYAGQNGSVFFIANAVGYSSISPSSGTFRWDYGDGYDTTALNFDMSTHTYTAPGNYTATLTYTNNVNMCTSVTSQVLSIVILNANFYVTQGANGLVNFYNTSTGTLSPTVYNWYFGDGLSSNAISPTHIYNSNGIFNVTLNINDISTNTNASISVPLTVNSNSSCAINYTYTTSLGGNVTFSSSTIANGSVSPGFFEWYFGDGSTANGFNLNQLSHVYPTDGVYYSMLTYTNSIANCSVNLIVAPIVVNNAGCNLTANFSYSECVNSLQGGCVNFTNTSSITNPQTVYTWDFGDGSIPFNTSYALNSYTYAANGSYLVTLTANNTTTPACVSTKTLLVNVTTYTDCVANSNFNMSPTGTPQVWNAIPSIPVNAQSTILAATWDWGDGSYSNTLYTSHTYSSASTYSICLSVTVSCGANSSSCMSYAIYKVSESNQDMNIIQVTVVNPKTVNIKNNVAETIDYSISPNPNNGLFDLTLNGVKGKKINVAVYNIVGALIYEIVGETTNDVFVKNIQLNDTSSGVYFIKVSADNKITTKKVVINK